MSEPDVIYRIDQDDVIVFVNDAWDRFALSNDSPHLTAEHVLGRSLWDFISDITTVELYQKAIARVRDGRILRFPFRCDAPQYRRFMEMILSPDEKGAVEFRSVTLAVESRPPVPLLAPHDSPAESLIRMCSWCKRIAVNGAWVEVEEGITLLRLFERTMMPPITHGICEECLQRMLAITAA